MKLALASLALALAACGSSHTHFDTSGGIAGNAGGGTTAGNTGGTTSGGTTGSATTGTTGTTGTSGSPAGGNLQAGVPFGGAQTVVYTIDQGTGRPGRVTITALQNAYSCSQALQGAPVGGYLVVQVTDPSGALPGPDTYFVSTDGGPGFTLEEGEHLADGGTRVDFTQSQGSVTFTQSPGSAQFQGSLDVQASGTGGQFTFAGTFGAVLCP